MSHLHLCNHCDTYTRCGEACAFGLSTIDTFDGPLPLALVRRTCPSCEDPIAEVDALPSPERGPLSLPTLERVVARATRAALQVAALEPEDAAGVFGRHVDPLLHNIDCTRTDPPTWTRMGAVLGAKAGWSGATTFAMPPDCPPGPSARCFMGAWSFAAGVVMQIRMEVGHG